ncbi:MAG: hypothetical protein IPK02_05350 [Candidatus Accumulibacter sp.]|uniref:Uncharacterized protein n=1 Tax=Candidatus Accumulibacter affinis TaxID=2954384 RepID=A0A935W408_9PROT|nr:hypothetical protein [Candidatus Accumulibacter affinis]
MLDHRFSELPELDYCRVRIVVVVALGRDAEAQEQRIVIRQEAEVAGWSG